MMNGSCIRHVYGFTRPNVMLAHNVEVLDIKDYPYSSEYTTLPHIVIGGMKSVLLSVLNLVSN